MAIYFPPQGFTTSRGELFGRRLSSVLNRLSEQKANRMQREQKIAETASGLMSMGVPQGVASAVSMMPERQQEMHLQQFLGSQAFGGSPQGQAVDGEMQPIQLQQQLASLGGQQPQQQQFQEEPDASQQSQLLQRFQSPIGAQDTTSLLSQLSPEVRQELQEISPGTPRNEVVARLRRADTPSTVRESIRRHPLKFKPTNKKTYAQLLATPRPTAADKARRVKMQRDEAREMMKMDLSERKFEWKKQDSIDKDTKKVYEETIKKYKSAEESDWRLSKLQALIDKGDLAGPTTSGILKGAGKLLFGVDLTAVGGADTEEFGKLSKDFLREAKAHFGSRMTQREVDLFLETIPNLLQSDEGKKRVIRNMQLFNKAAKIRYKAMRRIIKENKGNRPKNMDSIIEDRVKPEMDVVAKKFAKSVDFGAKQAGWATRKLAPPVIATGMGLTALGGIGLGLSGLGKILGLLGRK